ncbi:hypothetical protein ACFVT5_13465 [Streptomyces sp. NPDC058001]|uniref:hypothetical protein n=1 Tax=Streptomyces sp. NPDC058001 TaxID=3346300 RepID=UPI0036F01580
MTITDGRTHHAVALPTRRGRLLRMCVHMPVNDGSPGPTAARVLVTADVLLRSVEATGRQMDWVVEVPDATATEQTEAVRVLAASLGAHPPSGFTAEGGAREALGAPADVDVFGDGRRNAEQGLWLEVGTVRQVGTPESQPERDADLLAVRLDLLGRPYHRAATLMRRTLDDAERTLTRWRGRVARWACAPSQPVPEEYRSRAATALATDLATPAVLNLLLRAESAEDLPDGAKFETFAQLDRILGLELAREVGRVPAREGS